MPYSGSGAPLAWMLTAMPLKQGIVAVGRGVVEDRGASSTPAKNVVCGSSTVTRSTTPRDAGGLVGGLGWWVFPTTDGCRATG